ncbi:hypothetical protein C8T65DRAFT_98482 [Cerioporus squamosus]|nr:hypothetical protein C8T65DRAFT_98482 [Cerioporus squamosus]
MKRSRMMPTPSPAAAAWTTSAQPGPSGSSVRRSPERLPNSNDIRYILVPRQTNSTSASSTPLWSGKSEVQNATAPIPTHSGITSSVLAPTHTPVANPMQRPDDLIDPAKAYSFSVEDIREFREAGEGASSICGIDGCEEIHSPGDAESARDHIRKHYSGPKGTTYLCLRQGCEEPAQGPVAEQLRHMEKDHLCWRYRCPDANCNKKKAKVYVRWDTLQGHLKQFCGRSNHMTLEQVRSWIAERQSATKLRETQERERGHAGQTILPADLQDPTLPSEVADESPVELNVEASALHPDFQTSQVVAADADEYDADTDDSDWELS